MDITMTHGLVCAAVLAVGLGAVGCEDTTGGAESGTGRVPSQAAPGAGHGSAQAAVDSLTVRGRAPKAGCTRDRFGTLWAHTDHNGCGARAASVQHQVLEAFAQFTRGVMSCAY
jgi:hypothetical protein